MSLPDEGADQRPTRRARRAVRRVGARRPRAGVRRRHADRRAAVDPRGRRRRPDERPGAERLPRTPRPLEPVLRRPRGGRHRRVPHVHRGAGNARGLDPPASRTRPRVLGRGLDVRTRFGDGRQPGGPLGGATRRARDRRRRRRLAAGVSGRRPLEPAATRALGREIERNYLCDGRGGRGIARLRRCRRPRARERRRAEGVRPPHRRRRRDAPNSASTSAPWRRRC